MSTYFPCMPISMERTVLHVKLGGDVFASSKSAAYRLGVAVNGGVPVGPEISLDEIGFFWHYHARRRLGAGNGGGHIFYFL